MKKYGLNFAINYVLGGQTRVLVVQAADRDEAYEEAREWLVSQKLYSAALQGSARPASQSDLDAAEMTPNRALARAKLETLAWEQTPEGRRGRSGSRREVLLDTTDGTGMVPLGELTDFQLRRYIGPGRLEEAGDMRSNGRETPEEAFVEELQAMLDIGDRQIYFRVSPGSHQAFVQFYNIPQGVAAASAEGENNRLMLTAVDAGTDRVKVELTVRGPSFGEAYKLRSKTASTKKAAEYVAEFLNRAAKKAPYGHTFGNYDKNPMSKNARRPQSSLGLHEDHARIDGNPEPKFRIGDLVEDIDGTRKGRVEHIRGYDDLLRGYRYMVRDASGARLNWNETNMRLQRGHSPNASRERPKGRAHYVDHGDPVFIIGDHVERKDGRGEGKVKDIGTERGRLEYLVHLANGDKLWFDESELVVPAHWKNGRREEPDETAARELSLYIENEYSLVGAPNSQGKAIEKNLLKKFKSGVFDLDKSEQAWMYLIESGAKKYAKEYGSGEREWSNIFDKPTRELVAHEFATTFYEEAKLGNLG